MAKTAVSTGLGWIAFFIALTILPILVAGVLGGVAYVISYSMLNSDQVAKDLEELTNVEKLTEDLNELQSLNTNKRTSDSTPMSTQELRALLKGTMDTPLNPEHAQIAYAFRLMKTDYLKSATWNIKRKAVLKRDHYTCQQCQATGVLMDVHHMADYMLIPHEPITSLITLCRECHDNEHLLYGYPSTYEDYEEWDHKI